MDSDICTICNDPLLDGSQIRSVFEKGLKSFIKKSQEKQDDKWTFWIDKPKVTFHEKCRCRYLVSSSKPRIEEYNLDVTPCRTSSNLEENTLKKRRSDFSEHSTSDDHDSFSESVQYSSASNEVSTSTPNNNKSIFSSENHSYSSCGTSSTSGIGNLSSESSASSSSPNVMNNFNFSELCVVCGCFLYRYRNSVQCIRTRDTFCALVERSIDNRKSTILDRLAIVDSNTEIFYHKKCYGKLYHFVPKPEPVYQDIDTTDEDSIQEQFEISCHYLEQSKNFKHTMIELEQGIGQKILNKEKLFKKLREKYGECVQIIRHKGRPPIIIYKMLNASDIYNEWLHKKSLNEKKKLYILSFAAQILRADIMQASLRNDFHPSSDRFLDNIKYDIPNSLRTFLVELLFEKNINSTKNAADDIRLNSIAHSIISVLRPQSFISKLQLTVGTYVHQKTGSKLVIDLLSKLGVSASYYKIQLFKAFVITDPHGMDVGNVVDKYIFGNRDHNVTTLGGHDTFHCSGGTETDTNQIPTTIDKPTVPLQLLKKAFCSCQEDCTSAVCTCEKAGLVFTKMNRNCNGENCGTIDPMENRIDEEEQGVFQSNNESCDMNTQDDDSYSNDYKLSTDHSVGQMNISPDFDDRGSNENGLMNHGQSMNVDNYC